MDNSENIEDKIDWKKIDQLHNATINFSKNSLEIKKLLFVVIGISTPLIINLCNNQLDVALFISLYIIIFSFRIFDSYTYYYQKKLRFQMDYYFEQILTRNTNAQQKDSKKWKVSKMIIITLFNLSHFCFYGILIIVTIILNLLFCYNIIG